MRHRYLSLLAASLSASLGPASLAQTQTTAEPVLLRAEWHADSPFCSALELDYPRSSSFARSAMFQFSPGEFSSDCVASLRTTQRYNLGESGSYSFDQPADQPAQPWSASENNPFDSAVPQDVSGELLSLRSAGFLIARARLEVLEILREGNTCSAWFAQNEPAPAIKFASLHFQLDTQGEDSSVGEYSFQGWLFREPYVARAQQNVGAGSTITLNAHGAFFLSQATATLRGAGAGLPSHHPPRYLRVGDYLGGSLKAQVTTLLHEYAHVVGVVPVDALGSAAGQLSTQNTEVVVAHCRRQIEASPYRTILIPASLAQFEQPSRRD